MDSLVSLSAIFAVSLLGSWHCGLMCGGFSASLAAGSRRRLAAFHCGRLVSYVGAGAVAGWLGEQLFGLPGWMKWVVGFSFLFVFGVLLVATLRDFFPRRLGFGSGGRLAQGFGSGLEGKPGARPNPSGAFLSPFESALKGLMIRAYRWPGAGFFMGILNVFLPCGWLYGFLLAAASAGSLRAGALVMFAFWLGSLPILVLSGLYFWKMQAIVSPRLKPALQAVVIFSAMWSAIGFYI